MKTRVILYADEGKVLTDGEIFGKQIYLGENVSAERFTEIDEKEYEKVLISKAETE